MVKTRKGKKQPSNNNNNNNNNKRNNNVNPRPRGVRDTRLTISKNNCGKECPPEGCFGHTVPRKAKPYIHSIFKRKMVTSALVKNQQKHSAHMAKVVDTFTVPADTAYFIAFTDTSSSVATQFPGINTARAPLVLGGDSIVTRGAVLKATGSPLLGGGVNVIGIDPGQTVYQISSQDVLYRIDSSTSTLENITNTLDRISGDVYYVGDNGEIRNDSQIDATEMNGKLINSSQTKKLEAEGSYAFYWAPVNLEEDLQYVNCYHTTATGGTQWQCRRFIYIAPKSKAQTYTFTHYPKYSFIGLSAQGTIRGHNDVSVMRAVKRIMKPKHQSTIMSKAKELAHKVMHMVGSTMLESVSHLLSPYTLSLLT